MIVQLAGKGMFRIIIVVLLLLIGCVLLGYLMYKIWIYYKRKRQISIDVSKNKNASSRSRSKKKKKRSSTRSRRKSSSKSKRKISSRSSKKRKSSRPRSKSAGRKKKKKTITAKRLKSNKRKKTLINTDSTSENPPSITMNSIPQTFKPMNLKIDHPEKSSKAFSFYQTDENHLNKGFVAIARRRTRIDNHKKYACLCINCNDPSSTIFQVKNHVDSIKNVLPCDENDTANLSKYEYELNYDEEHLFRC